VFCQRLQWPLRNLGNFQTRWKRNLCIFLGSPWGWKLTISHHPTNHIRNAMCEGLRTFFYGTPLFELFKKIGFDTLIIETRRWVSISFLIRIGWVTFYTRVSFIFHTNFKDVSTRQIFWLSLLQIELTVVRCSKIIFCPSPKENWENFSTDYQSMRLRWPGDTTANQTTHKFLYVSNSMTGKTYRSWWCGSRCNYWSLDIALVPLKMELCNGIEIKFANHMEN